MSTPRPGAAPLQIPPFYDDPHEWLLALADRVRAQPGMGLTAALTIENVCATLRDQEVEFGRELERLEDEARDLEWQLSVLQKDLDDAMQPLAAEDAA